MAEQLTPQQEQAVKNRGGKLLVSAAAGSGKTKVLVDRLLMYVMDERDPADLDEFLIITYTKAAAAELRGKIAAKLTERLAENPENRHLQRQMQRLYMTKISTVHSFCGDILREYAYQMDIPGDFRVADENECAQLRETVMTRMLDSAYETAENDPDFRAFVDAQGLGRNDRLVPEILLKVYDSARCHLDPDGWLDSCIRHANVEGLSDASQTLWGSYLMDDLMAYLDLQITAVGSCAALAACAEGMEKPALLLHQTLEQMKTLRSCKTWDDILLWKNIDYGRLTISKKCPDQALGERIKAVRKACKDGLAKKLKVFTDPSSQVLSDMAATAPSVRGIVSLVRRFSKEFDRAKQQRRILDFGDLEHRMLDLLLGKSRSGMTAAARELSLRFREIMVDEYQDSNAVQDAIFSALTEKRNNCFMVGDVKQSIYQFRLADPGIFLEKYNAYQPAETAKDPEGRKVMLSSNFRSGGAVLAGVNDVFRLCMSPCVGGLKYGADEALVEGVPHEPLGEPEVELWTIPVQESTYPEEAAFVAGRIHQLLDGTHYIRDKAELRTIRPEDIAILLRSPGSVGSYYRAALSAYGIRCVSGGGEDLLQTPEVGTLRAILQTISNPRQDIPLIAAIASPVFGFTADDLAEFRSKKRYGTVYDALTLSESSKADQFMQILSQLRKDARMLTLAQLIEKIFLLTRMDSIYSAMEGGQGKAANLRTFYSYVCDYEAAGRRDLEQFLEHLESIEDKGLIAAGEQTAAGAVTMMSIHKSKGLEFPVVIVSGLSRIFNRESARAHVLCDQSLGLGLSAVDSRNRLRYPTIAKRAIGLKTISDSLSEEMRVLYVALTRAKDRLIMTYASDNLEKDLSDILLRMEDSPTELLTQDVACPGEWVLMAALQRTEAGELFRLAQCYHSRTCPGEPAWLIRVCPAEAITATQQQEHQQNLSVTDEQLKLLKEGLSFRYGYLAATKAPSKQTATQRKGRVKDEEAAEHSQPPKNIYRSFRKPSFADAAPSGADHGNATHGAMQYLRFAHCSSVLSVEKELQRLVNEGFLTQAQKEMIHCQQIAAFFETDLGKRLMTAPQVLREFKFSILDDGIHYDPQLTDEKILLQGVVDCAMIEDDGITVVDFKTDSVTEVTIGQTAEKYRLQVSAYAQALSKIYRKPIKSALLYFFSIGKFVTVQ